MMGLLIWCSGFAAGAVTAGLLEHKLHSLVLEAAPMRLRWKALGLAVVMVGVILGVTWLYVR